MRPLRLEAEGFTCYRDRQEPLDFTRLSLFAIAGATGAGKSSILDTMLYALYGEVPRVGKQGIGEFISHGRDALSVCLDFSLRGSVYRVVRRVKRRKGGSLQTAATLAEVTGGVERSLADNVRPVNEEIARLLGLDYDAFTQTVILPQDEFARFLRAEPKGQRAILQHLLRHHVFERMREEAERRRSSLDAERRGAERELSTYDKATPEAVADNAAELRAARERLEAAFAGREAIDAETRECRRLRQLTDEACRLRAQRAGLDAREREITGAREMLALARRAGEIAPRIDGWREAVRRDAEAEARRGEAAKELADLAGRCEVAEADFVAASQAAAECAPLIERIRRIDEIKGDLERRRALTRQAKGLGEAVRTAEREAATRKKQFDARRRDLKEAESAAAQRRAALTAAAYDEAQHAAIEDLWEPVVQARALSEEVARLEREHAAAGAALASAERDDASAGRSHARASKARDLAAATCTSASLALEQASRRHQAAALRAHLHAGTDCPVCLQTVALVPDVEAPPELSAMAAQLEDAKTRQRRAADALDSASRTHAAAGGRLAAARAALEGAASNLRARTEARHALDHRLAAALPPASPEDRGVDVLAWIERRRSELRAAKSAHEDAQVLLRQAEAALGSLEKEVMSARAIATTAATELARLVEDERECCEELRSVSGRIDAVSAHDDPSSERTGLARQVTVLQERERAAREVLSALRQEVAVASARVEVARAATASTRAEAEAARVALDEALRRAGFATADEAAAALLSPALQSELDAQIRSYDDDRAGVMRRLLEVEPVVSGREVDRQSLDLMEARLAAAVEAWRDAGLAVSRLEAEQARLSTAVEKRASLAAEFRALQSRHAVAAEMAGDLRGDAFQEYLLEEAFRALVTGASVRLRQMSNRYTLEWDAGDFFVIDHDNAGERRRAETLSGGETFMASLCLALQLGDEVLRTSGALQMDSLFVDEGFGSLDASSLSEVTDAMEALRQDGGRLVGVISHRPELTDRLPGCVRIEKGSGDSRWVVERVG